MSLVLTRRALVRLLALGTLAPVLVGAQPAGRAIDWDALARETEQRMAEYFRINTSNPPGNELATARWLKDVLAREGIEAQILDTATLGPGRANLYARIKGKGTGKAIALVHHMDVVPASPQYWSVDPFSGSTKDGYLYGRGALDMKGTGIIHLMTFIAAKRTGLPLERDLVFIANADEELGSTGASVFARDHKALLADVEYVLTEGAGNPSRNGALQYWGVGVGEKRTFWQRLTVNGTPGHGSRPTPGNPVPRLVAALNRLAMYETPLHLTPAVERYLKAQAVNYIGQYRQWLENPRAALTDTAARAWLVSDLERNALLRNTISLTVLTASNKTNVIPPVATAEIDVRLLPDQNADSVLAELTRVVADTAVHFSPVSRPASPLDNPIDTDLVAAITRAARERDATVPVVPLTSTGGTDRPHYRALGIVTYGFSPFVVDVEDSRRGVHGNDERIATEQIPKGLRFMYDVVRYAQQRPAVP
jgi:acetylornithine deacetylase/succinyl-diaminopimelate desuccinylase-like protein